jgi:hypothetical protein
MHDSRFYLALTLLVGCASTNTQPDSDLQAVVATEIVHESPLDWTLGEWHGRRCSDDGATTNPIRVRVSPILGGAGQLREMWVEHDGGVYRGMSIQLCESATGEWTRYYANDVRGSLVTLHAVGGPGSSPDRWQSGPNDKGRWSENRSEHPDDDTWISSVSRTTDGGLTWQGVFVDKLRRLLP